MCADIRIEPVLTAGDVSTVARLAHEIWYEYYPALIGQAQVDYMVGKFQSEAAIEEQRRNGYEYFLTIHGEQPIGYLAFLAEPEQQALFISKLYLHGLRRSAGTGRRCMEFIEQLATRRGLTMLWLTVNKGNPSVKAYERLGFHIAADIQIDIGGGFVMDDYRMEKQLILHPKFSGA
jgi:diamine N-acetyltransferase